MQNGRAELLNGTFRWERVSNHDVQMHAAAGGSRAAVWEKRSRPWRVVPLAVLTVAATVAASGGAMAMIRDLSGHRYATDVLRSDLRHLQLVRRDR